LELQQAFDILLQRPDKLMLVTGELWPSQRVLKDEGGKSVPGETQMENLEHLGQYVYEMTNAKVQQLRAERGLSETVLVAPPLEEHEEGLGMIEENDEGIEEEMTEGFEAEEEG
jgi:intron-binding protein aquarius